ncbi:preprotein translocase subunit YajC [Microbacterium sp.]|uniref:preprotein translocase subunit YajC n=1 Tax=Microbacterium sp. TaxID=51671 RepID=UPI002613FDE0|nr:preprotein translocase subunit YajC [Microbacterium sp.]
MELILFGLLAVLLVFMIFNTRRRNKQMKEQQEEKARKTVPGVKVLLQGGLYGTIVAYDADDLDEPALIEIAPGTVIEVHSQAILRIVDPTEDDAADTAVDVDGADADADAEIDEDTFAVNEELPAPNETPEETRARLERDSDNK